jgi:hypothetical protein
MCRCEASAMASGRESKRKQNQKHRFPKIYNFVKTKCKNNFKIKIKFKYTNEVLVNLTIIKLFLSIHLKCQKKSDNAHMCFTKVIADCETQEEGLHQQETDEEPIEDGVKFFSSC